MVQVFNPSSTESQSKTAGETVTEGRYDMEQSRHYVEAKTVDWRSRVELYSTLNFIGDLKGKRVIDMACGDGWLTRHLRDGGASYVLGTDMSPFMIDLAKKKEDNYKGDGPKIEYEVEDARRVTVPEKEDDLFDVVASNWLLVNAKNRLEVREMCQGFARKAKPGAKLCTIVQNPELVNYPDNAELNKKMKPYGNTVVLPPKTGKPVEDGALILVQCYSPTGDLVIELENYHHTTETYTQELETAGFESVEIKYELSLSPEKDDADDWKDILTILGAAGSIMIGIVGIKK